MLWLVGLCNLGAEASPVPDWVSSSGRSPRYPEAEFLTGFGVSEESFAAAEEQARNDLARQIEVTVEGRQEIVAQSVEAGGLTRDEMRFYERSSSRHRVVLQGLRFERHEEKGKRFVLALLERRRAVEMYQAEVSRQMGEMRELLGRSGAWNDSLRSAVQAATLAGKAWSNARILQSLSRSGKRLDSLYVLRAHAIERFQGLMEDVQIGGSDPVGVGTWGEGLEESLQVKLARSGQPLAGVPVEFCWARGVGQLEGAEGGSGERIAVATDGSGRAAVRVKRVGSVSREMRVQARIALSRFAGEADEEAMGLLASRTAVPEKVFRFRSQLFAGSPPRLLPVFLNGSADEQTFADGESIAVMVRLGGPASVCLLQIDARGRLGMAGQLEVQGEDGGPGWAVTRDGAELILRFDAQLIAQQGNGLESFLVVALPLGGILEFPPGGYYNSGELWEAIARRAGGNAWGAGWVGYEIVKSEE